MICRGAASETTGATRSPVKEEKRMLEQIEQVLNEQVRPQLAMHGGEIRSIGYENGVYRFELLGCCSDCPAASITTEELIRGTITEAVPQVKDVILVDGVDEDLVAQARAILTRNRP